jgi:RHS repeat-associated protein
VDSTGTIRARYDYDPYGNVTKVSGDLDTDFAYTGHYYHAASGLHLAPYRGYDPRLGRWLSRDPIEEEGGNNLYGYVRGNPVQFIDRLGYDREEWSTVSIWWMYHDWLAVDTWDDFGNKTGQVALHVGGWWGTAYIVESQCKAKNMTGPGYPLLKGKTQSTPLEDRALVYLWLLWQNGQADPPSYYSWPTCIGASKAMTNYRGPKLRFTVPPRSESP